MSTEWTKGADARSAERQLRRENERAWSRWLDEYCGPGTFALHLETGEDREELATMLAEAGAVCPPKRGR